MNDINTYIRLKYRIISDDEATWEYCHDYPKDVLISWYKRCRTGPGYFIDTPYLEYIEKKYEDYMISYECYSIVTAIYCMATEAGRYFNKNKFYKCVDMKLTNAIDIYCNT